MQTHITGVCAECSQCLGHTGFAPTHGMCAFPVYTAQAPGCSAGGLSKAGPGWHALPRSELLRFRFSGTSQRLRLGWACVFRLSQVQAAPVTWCLVNALSPGGAVSLITSPIPAAQLPGRAEGALSQVRHVSPLGSSSLAETLLADVNHPGSQENLVSNWEPAHSLVVDVIPGAKIVHHPPALAVVHLPFYLWGGRGWPTAG